MARSHIRLRLILFSIIFKFTFFPDGYEAAKKKIRYYLTSFDAKLNKIIFRFLASNIKQLHNKWAGGLCVS